MKRILLMLLVVMLFCFSLASCSSFDAVGESKELLAEFITAYNEEDAQAEMSFIHDALTEEIGGAENMEIILTARRAILGKITGYEVTNTSFETANKMTEVVLTVSMDYENSPGVEDTYTFLTIDDGLYITGFNLKKEANIDKIITDYYSDYADPEARRALYIPCAETLIDDETFELASKKVEVLAGNFVNFEILSTEYAVLSVGDTDAVCYKILKLRLSYDNMTFVSDIQFSREGDILGINYENMLPETIENFRAAYVDALSASDRDTLLSLYNENFFGVLSEQTQDSWWNTFYQPLLGSYGALQDYEVVEWDWDTVDVAGTQTNCFIIYTQSVYDDAVMQEKIIVSANDGTILGHYLQEA